MNVAFYVTAHQDDWLFFRGEQAFQDLNTADTRVVFIYLTAGDAGETDGWWEAREQGALAAIRAVIPPSALTFHTQKINGKFIATYECGNSISYCMRFPNPVDPNAVSLARLRDGQDTSATTVDETNIYNGWSDVWQTLQAIVGFETQQSSNPNPWVNCHDYNRRRNPNDHVDHWATADALRMFAASTYKRAWFVGDDDTNRPDVLSSTLVSQKKALFDAYSNKVLEITTLNGNSRGPNAIEWGWWATKSYFTPKDLGSNDD